MPTLLWAEALHLCCTFIEEGRHERRGDMAPGWRRRAVDGGRDLFLPLI
jgi:hypothetical protein